MTIRSYNDSSIKRFDAIEHMRAVAHMYVGDIHAIEGHIQYLVEFVDNVCDEAGELPFDITMDIILVKCHDSYQVVLWDNGRGIPLASTTDSMTRPMTSGKHKDAYGATIGVHGMGVKATAAMSKVFVAISYRKEGIALVRMDDLVVTRSEVIDRPQPGSGVLAFYEVIDDVAIPFDRVKEMIPEMLMRSRFATSFIPNLKIRLHLSTKRIPRNLFDATPEEIRDKLMAWPIDETCIDTAKSSPKDFLYESFNIPQKEMWELAIDRPYDSTDGLGFNLLFTIPRKDDNPLRKEAIIGCINNKPIHGASDHHNLTAFEAIKSVLAPKIENADIREFFLHRYRLPLYAIINVKFGEARFPTQTKRNFRDSKFVACFQSALMPLLHSVNQYTWTELYDLLISDIEAAFYKGSQHVASGSTNIASLLHRFGNYKDCTVKDPSQCELIIAEGQSAGGNILKVRDAKTQAVLFLTGKSLNSVKATDRRLMDNPVVSDIMTVIGLHLNSPDLSHFRFRNILILTDADPDGDHIAAHLIKLFHRICPQLLYGGKIFVATPPLYIFQHGASAAYLRDDLALLDVMINSIYTTVYDLAIQDRHNGRVVRLDTIGFRSICHAVHKIGDEIDRIANHLVIDPTHLELMLHCVNFIHQDNPNTNAIKQILKLDVVNFEPKTRTLILSSGSIDVALPLTNLQTVIRSEILPLLEEYNWKHFNLIVKHKLLPTPPRPMSFYHLYREFKVLSREIEFRRCKGLGEMPAKDLGIACIYPETRSDTVINHPGDLQQITALLDVDTAARKKLI